MLQIQFYQLSTSPLEKALPRLLNKAYESGYRLLVKLANPELVQVMDQVMWTFTPSAFLPHGTLKDPVPEKQPVLLGTEIDNKNGATVLCITDGTEIKDIGGYERILDMFDGSNPESLTAARARWKAYKDAGFDLSYFSQKDDGGWEKKAA